MKIIHLLLMVFLFCACANKDNKQQIYESKRDIIVDKLRKNEMSLEEKMEIMKPNFLDSLTVEQKKDFVKKVLNTRPGEIDSTVTEAYRDSFIQNTEIRDCIRFIWLLNELDTCTLK